MHRPGGKAAAKIGQPASAWQVRLCLQRLSNVDVQSLGRGANGDFEAKAASEPVESGQIRRMLACLEPGHVRLGPSELRGECFLRETVRLAVGDEPPP